MTRKLKIANHIKYVHHIATRIAKQLHIQFKVVVPIESPAKCLVMDHYFHQVKHNQEIRELYKVRDVTDELTKQMCQEGWSCFKKR